MNHFFKFYTPLPNKSCKVVAQNNFIFSGNNKLKQKISLKNSMQELSM